MHFLTSILGHFSSPSVLAAILLRNRLISGLHMGNFLEPGLPGKCVVFPDIGPVNTAQPAWAGRSVLMVPVPIQTGESGHAARVSWVFQQRELGLELQRPPWNDRGFGETERLITEVVAAAPWAAGSFRCLWFGAHLTKTPSAPRGSSRLTRRVWMTVLY